MTLDADFIATLAAARAGEDDAVARIYRDLNPPLLRYLRARVPSEADDLASEVWVGVARQLASFEGDEESFRAWLFTIARRQVASHWRRASRRRTEVAEIEAFCDLAARDDTEEAALAGSVAQAAVDALVAGLSEEQAEVVLLRVVGGLSVTAVAEIIGKRAGAVRVIQHRAMQRLVRDQTRIAKKL